MKVICIGDKNSGIKYIGITIGKEYDSTHIAYDTYYRIKDDSDKFCIYPLKLFITTKEARNKKLEELGI